MVPWQSVFKQMTIYSFEWRNRKTYSYWKSWFPFSMKRLDPQKKNIYIYKQVMARTTYWEQLPLLIYNKQNSRDTLLHSNLQYRMITNELLGPCSLSLILCTMNNSLHHLRGGSALLLNRKSRMLCSYYAQWHNQKVNLCDSKWLQKMLLTGLL